MNGADVYKELVDLTKNRDRWEEKIPYVANLLSSEPVGIKAKALWLLGEMGLRYPASIWAHVPAMAVFLDDAMSLLRERAVNALGRIGRGCYRSIEPYWKGLFRFAADEDANVRLSFIWASENIATNTPDVYADFMEVFAWLLHDGDDRVRMEAPEMFRVLGKRRPEFVRPYIEQLRSISETDGNRVVRIHCLGAIKAAAGDPEEAER
ncbi:MAG: HEAT repeat domain-containing protein [Oscillospiraceae bacterium]|nr:HEAT repeat domain-containing protein [Oscillospiraceae bacterium]